jgi:hypothetical protein
MKAVQGEKTKGEGSFGPMEIDRVLLAGDVPGKNKREYYTMYKKHFEIPKFGKICRKRDPRKQKGTVQVTSSK